MSKTLKISYSVESVVTLDEKGQAFLLDLFRKIKGGVLSKADAPEGFVAAAEKLPSDAPDELILRTIVGEVTSLIIETEVPTFYPPADFGFRARISKVAYQETPEKLDPPANAVPQIVALGDRNVH
jgi:hypothetical protein